MTGLHGTLIARTRAGGWLMPDPASQSGHSVRMIGYSGSAGAVITVVLVDVGADPDERPDRDWWGSNAWMANDCDRGRYGEPEL